MDCASTVAVVNGLSGLGVPDSRTFDDIELRLLNADIECRSDPPAFVAVRRITGILVLEEYCFVSTPSEYVEEAASSSIRLSASR
jgi:hypothetical protein